MLVAVGIWVITLTFGANLLWKYAATPGMPAAVEKAADADWLLASLPGKPRLVMVLHPECPCSRASLGELDRIMARNGDSLVASVILIGIDASSPPMESEFWQIASRMHGVQVQLDSTGDLAKQLGAMTSGQVMAYDNAGVLRFSGGITSGRGHAGSNAGADAVDAIARAQLPAVSTTDVFGCELW